MRFINWLLGRTKYKLVVFFADEEQPRVFYLKKITKKTGKHFVGRDLDDMFFELVTDKEVSFYINEIE